MIKIFRRLRIKLLSEKQFSKYLFYAIGEIILVVIGILIALQINNWNQNKIEQIALSGYLTSISQNIQSDIISIEYLKKSRIDAISRTPFMNSTLLSADYLNRKDVMFGSETLRTISSFEYFNADLSGFESIKSSGYLSKLQGKRIEKLLYKYYNIVREIQVKEQDLNEILREAFSDFSSQGFEKLTYVTYPDFIGDEDQLNSLQPFLKEILFHPSAQSLYNQAFQRAPQIIVSYENLITIGRQIIELIQCDCDVLESSSLQELGKTFNLNSTKGYSKVLINSTVYSNIYEQGWASSSDVLGMEYGINELIIETDNIDWAVVYYRHPSNTMDDRPTKDYSYYSSIKLELKGREGGETVYVALKDGEDPDDGSESRIPLTLSDKWETYEIPLSEFKTADLKELFIVASLVFLDDEQQIKVRNIDYLK